jgi:hypothetical protein
MRDAAGIPVEDGHDLVTVAERTRDGVGEHARARADADHRIALARRSGGCIRAAAGQQQTCRAGGFQDRAPVDRLNLFSIHAASPVILCACIAQVDSSGGARNWQDHFAIWLDRCSLRKKSWQEAQLGVTETCSIAIILILNNIREQRLEHESHHHHHPHKTGVRWLDLGLRPVGRHRLARVALAGPAFGAFDGKAGRGEQLSLRRADALDVDGKAARTDDGFNRRVKYMMENNGVGPARIEWVEFKFKGEPVHNLMELLQKCCTPVRFRPRPALGIDVRGGIAGALIRPGAMVHMFTWEEPKTRNPVFDALHKQMDDISYSACYCSVFDECYVTATATTRSRSRSSSARRRKSASVPISVTRKLPSRPSC